jgi:DnaK suppressor protein
MYLLQAQGRFANLIARPALRETVMTQLSSTDQTQFRQLLQERRSALHAIVREVLRRSDNERYVEIAGQVHDTEEEALADLLVDVNLADVHHHVQELRDVDAALQRLTLGTYGVCVRCGEPIDSQRLRAYPTATRCITCQRIEEHTRLSTPAPSM